MRIPITDQYALTSTEYAWAISKSKKRKHHGKDVTDWEAIRWYSTLEGAAKALGDMMLRQSDATTLAEAMAEVERISEMLCKALTTNILGVPNERT